MANYPYPQSNYDPRTGLIAGRKQNPYQNLYGGFRTGQAGAGGGGFAAGGRPTDTYGGNSLGGPIDLPGFTPNYKDLIEKALAPLKAQLGAEGSADATTRNAALMRGIGQFGEQFDPASAQAAFGQDFYNQAGIGDLLPQANQLAAENTKAGFSVSSKLQSALEKSVQQIQDALAARGLLRSGALGTSLDAANKEFRTGQYDARQSLADYLSSAQQGYVAGERARQSQLDAAGRQEAVNQATLNPPQGSVTIVPVGKDANGRTYYKRPDGSLVYEDGSPYTPAAVAPPPPGAPPPGAPPPVVPPPFITPPASPLGTGVGGGFDFSHGAGLGYGGSGLGSGAGGGFGLTGSSVGTGASTDALKKIAQLFSGR